MTITENNFKSHLLANDSQISSIYLQLWPHCPLGWRHVCPCTCSASLSPWIANKDFILNVAKVKFFLNLYFWKQFSSSSWTPLPRPVFPNSIENVVAYIKNLWRAWFFPFLCPKVQAICKSLWVYIQNTFYPKVLLRMSATTWITPTVYRLSPPPPLLR